jgi:hypothetical protein
METYKHGKDPKYKKQVADMWESLAKGFDNSFGSA